MLELTAEEAESLRCQIGTSKRGGRRYRPFAFTEQGVAMLSSVLRSERAVRVNIEIMRAFVQLRQMMSSHADLARKLEALQKRFAVDRGQCRQVIDRGWRRGENVYNVYRRQTCVSP